MTGNRVLLVLALTLLALALFAAGVGLAPHLLVNCRGR